MNFPENLDPAERQRLIGEFFDKIAHTEITNLNTFGTLMTKIIYEVPEIVNGFRESQGEPPIEKAIDIFDEDLIEFMKKEMGIMLCLV